MRIDRTQDQPTIEPKTFLTAFKIPYIYLLLPLFRILQEIK
jgi:hypothetical protein